jgi:hypothetical protein
MLRRHVMRNRPGGHLDFDWGFPLGIDLRGHRREAWAFRREMRREGLLKVMEVAR